MPSIMRVLAPGFVDDTAKFELTVLLTRITFSYIIFISLVSLFGGILNSIERFAAVAATPILMNVCLISALVFFSAYLPSSVHALAYGVILAGVVQFLWLAYHCYRHGMLPCFKWPRITPEVREMLLLMAPAALGVGVVQINLFIDNILASMIPNAVSYLYYADRMNELPLAIIGIAVGTALLPMLTKHYKAGRIFEGQASMNRALEFTMLLGLPAAAAFVIVAEPIIQVVFERGEFTKEDTDATHRALMAYAIGLPAFLLTKVFAPGFFAQKDTKTPFMIAAVCVVINLIFNLLLMGPLQHVGLALATSIAGWVNATWMAILLRKRNILFPDHEVQFRLPRILLATMLMAVALYTMLHFVIPFFAEGALLALLTLIALIASGLVSYGLSVWLLDVVSIKRLKAYLRQTKPLASAEED
jgi:putative peptidoglycan lipid II flippase